MPSVKTEPAILLLEDGTVFTGFGFGKPATATGELCFNTGMTGYQELFTDPSYYGQLVVTTHVHIGNYGVKNTDVESDGIKISGLICKNFSTNYSRIPADHSLESSFLESNIPVFADFDTRSIVRYIRDKGAMNAIISSETTSLELLKEQLDRVPSMAGLELSSTVSTPKSYEVGNADATYRVALLDLGVKQNIIRSLVQRDCFVSVFPAKTSFEVMQEFAPDGYMISNGPGDPSAMDYAVKTVTSIVQAGIPLFGICLGHQIFATSMGAGTYKMFNGHRGINHPIKNLISGHSEITSQNHGFAVSADDVNRISELEVTHIHLNDGTIAGIRHRNGKAFSVQYHPESSPGPHDSRYLFDQFIVSMKVSKLQEQTV
jgi:carbamoyl-phosphate synthase small subunit